MDVTNLSGKTVLVTGAGSGIGRETALAFARRGANVAVCDINEQGLGRIAEEIRALGRKVTSRKVDVSSLEQMEQFAASVHAEIEAVDILVNNAGVAVGGGLLETTMEDWNWILGINLKGVIHGCHCFIPKMVARGRGGHVVNLASTAAYLATEALVAYSTTKFAVLGLSEALRDELHRHGIGVTAVCPGIINTPITTSARLRGKTADPEAQRRMIEFYRWRNYGPERVAEKIVKAVARNAAVVPVSPEAWLAYILKRLSPGLVAWMNRKLSERFQAPAGRNKN